ncbi:MAG: hypothetical protein A2277_20800 [Desulfobacterales bacterium RIFOXYA12_FULL_46_15]|nr:MAG: hypothetical protein A2277_20800 [Desulfobacterales bacterium RIFOXYA12_FULL_46_15]
MAKKKCRLEEVLVWLTLFGFLAFLTGCGDGLPKELKKDAQSLPGAIKTGLSLVDKHREKYEGQTGSSDFKSIERFSVRENWPGKFLQAKDELNRAKEVYDKELSPLIKKNTPELVPDVQKQVERIKQIIKDAEELYRYPSSRFLMILETKKNAGSVHSKAKTNASAILEIAGRIKEGPVAKGLLDFSDSAEKINARFLPLSTLGEESPGHLDRVKAEYEHHASGIEADYAVLTDSAKAISDGLEQAKRLEAALSKDLAGLYSSYTKILKDMKEDYVVTIKRESWDENAEYDNPVTVAFQREISPELYEILTQENLDEIAVITAGFTGSSMKSNIGDAWKELSINPADQWPRGHNAASFYVEDTKETYFHKYILEENGETKETGWEQVDESFYEANLEFLGMAILAKPYGVFEQDRLIQAAPPGMAYVGNQKYGEWKEDNHGDRFWSWYGKYAFFSHLFSSMPFFYNYNSWNGWHNNYRYQKPYFGDTKNGLTQYGTHGAYVKQSPGFQSTAYAQSGGFKNRTASVRGAGEGLRGGGPGSRGK